MSNAETAGKQANSAFPDKARAIAKQVCEDLEDAFTNMPPTELWRRGFIVARKIQGALRGAGIPLEACESVDFVEVVQETWHDEEVLAQFEDAWDKVIYPEGQSLMTMAFDWVRNTK